MAKYRGIRGLGKYRPRKPKLSPYRNFYRNKNPYKKPGKLGRYRIGGGYRSRSYTPSPMRYMPQMNAERYRPAPKQKLSWPRASSPRPAYTAPRIEYKQDPVERLIEALKSGGNSRQREELMKLLEAEFKELEASVKETERTEQTEASKVDEDLSEPNQGETEPEIKDKMSSEGKAEERSEEQNEKDYIDYLELEADALKDYLYDSEKGAEPAQETEPTELESDLEPQIETEPMEEINTSIEDGLQDAQVEMTEPQQDLESLIEEIEPLAVELDIGSEERPEVQPDIIEPIEELELLDKELLLEESEDEM